MKLDPTVMRTMNAQDFRVLEAVEKGMKDHALVPMPLISSIANLRHGGSHKIISSLLRDKLLSHERKKGNVDGYRVTNAGYDILALHNLKQRGFVVALGQRIGTGKESDIYLGATKEGGQVVLKFHRLGRTSFRNVKKKRDYGGAKAFTSAHSWLFLSRLSALKEYAFMKALYNVNYPTPTPIAHNRHIVIMSLVRGIPLYQVYPKQLSVEQAADIYQQAIGIATSLASRHGLVHCDLNEFNLLVDLSGIQSTATTSEDPYVRHSGAGQSVCPSQSGNISVGALSKPAWEQSLEQGDNVGQLPEPQARLTNGEPKPVVTLIDFPQMVSIRHANAKELFERDLACLRRFFEMKLFCTIPDDDDHAAVTWESTMAGVPPISEEDGGGLDGGYDNSVVQQHVDVEQRLDEELKASGFNCSAAASDKRDLELYYFNSQPGPSVAIAEGDEDEEGDVSGEDENSDDDGDDDESSQQSCNRLASPERDQFDAPLEGLVGSTNFEIVDCRSVTTTTRGHLSREELEEIARQRVRKQLEEDKRRARKQGAFRKGNRNKTSVKGKRAMSGAIVF